MNLVVSGLLSWIPPFLLCLSLVDSLRGRINLIGPIFELSTIWTNSVNSVKNIFLSSGALSDYWTAIATCSMLLIWIGISTGAQAALAQQRKLNARINQLKRVTLWEAFRQLYDRDTDREPMFDNFSLERVVYDLGALLFIATCLVLGYEKLAAVDSFLEIVLGCVCIAAAGKIAKMLGGTGYFRRVWGAFGVLIFFVVVSIAVRAVSP
jgi:hypothetical protein